LKKPRSLAVAPALFALVLLIVSLHGLSLAAEVAPGCIALPPGDAELPGDANALTNAGVIEMPQSPGDYHLDERWGLNRLETPLAWQITRGDDSVIVAVLDTGISKDNHVLADIVVAEVNLTDSPTCDDLYGHGTHVAGTIAAIAPGCQLLNVKVADDRGRSEASVVARGIVWAVDHGAHVINISLSMRASSNLEEAVDYAWSHGAIIIAAAGNQGVPDPVYPAYYDNCLAVAGSNNSDSLALLSNYGEWVDVAAPGFNIYSEMPRNQYGYKTGTSAAAAHVSGVAALGFSIAQDSSGNGAVNDEVRWAIENSCSPIVGDGVANGLVNALRTLNALQSVVLP
jgi:thermitase